METIISLILFVFIIVWAVRIETGINKLNTTVERIAKHLESKGEKK